MDMILLIRLLLISEANLFIKRLAFPLTSIFVNVQLASTKFCSDNYKSANIFFAVKVNKVYS